MQQNETNPCVGCVMRARTSRREFSHNPDLGVVWPLHCQIWHFQTSSLVLLPRCAAGSAQRPLFQGKQIMLYIDYIHILICYFH